MKKLISLCMFAALLLAASCTKEGPQGPAGTNGTNGTNGLDGNANVQYSDWISVAQADWTGIGSTTISKGLAESKITTDMIDKGVVLVYHQYAGNTYLLPYTYTISGSVFDFKLTLGYITIRGWRMDGGNINSISTVKFRYILIPSNVHTRMSKPFSEMTYQEVCTTYHIPM